MKIVMEEVDIESEKVGLERSRSTTADSLLSLHSIRLYCILNHLVNHSINVRELHTVLFLK